MDLVTGGTGIVGSHILEELTRDGLNVRAIRRGSSDINLVQKIFNHYNNPHFDNIEWVNGDITDIPSIEEAMKGVTNVYHAAAIVSFSKKDRKLMYKINVEGTANIVNACIASNIKKLGFISSTAAIGKGEGNNWHNEKAKWTTTKDTSYYAITKHTAEAEVWRGIEEGLNAVIINPSVIIGPGDMKKSSGSLFGTINKGLKFYTNGINGFVDARDVSRGIVSLVNSNLDSERYLCIGENISFKTLFEHISKSLNKPTPSILAKPWLTNIAWRLTGFSAFITGQKPSITKESASSSHSINQYENDKLTKALNFNFTPIKDACENTGSFFLK